MLKANLKLHSHPVSRILDEVTREQVGWVYEWNTLEKTEVWLKDRPSNVVYENCSYSR